MEPRSKKEILLSGPPFANLRTFRLYTFTSDEPGSIGEMALKNWGWP